MTRASLMQVYGRLFRAYGAQNWWPAQTPFEMMLGAVLTQNTAWRNVERALDALGRTVTPGEVAKMPEDVIKDRIRPSGFFNQKAPRLKALARWTLCEEGREAGQSDMGTAALRAQLLEINGVGRETADSILLYAFSRPVYVVDAYTRRVFARLGYAVARDYDDFAAAFYRGLKHEHTLFNEYHALIVTHCKSRCFKNRPDCAQCPLKALCKINKQA